MEPNQDYSFDCNKYIDSHCHLQDYSSVELEQVLSNCISKGLQLIYTNATNKDDFYSMELINHFASDFNYLYDSTRRVGKQFPTK